MVEISNIKKYFGDVHAVDGVNLKVEAGEMLCLLGPSGCGKTTLLRILAGFIKPTDGTVLMGGTDVTALPPENRPTSLVFQNYALFPHMNVFDNIAFGLRVRKWPLKKIEESVEDMLKLVGLTGLHGRAIRQLSGGQQQRVALARALVMQPKVLLLDEPLSNLDAKLRVETRIQIREIQKSVGITSIFVTHDQEEALTISDRIAIMDRGNIIQTGTPEEIYHQPNSYFVADFVGKSNFLKGSFQPGSSAVGPAGSGIFTLTDGTVLKVVRTGVPENADTIVIRPEKVRFVEGPDAVGAGKDTNVLPCEILHVTFLGEVVYYHVRLETDEMMLVPVYGRHTMNAASKEGEKAYIGWESSAALVLSA